MIKYTFLNEFGFRTGFNQESCHYPKPKLHLILVSLCAMRIGLFSYLLALINFSALSQVHNRVAKVNVGVTYDQFGRKELFKELNDSSTALFEQETIMPYISYSHEFVLGSVLSVSGKIGFQYMNEYYDNQYFGSPFLLASANPQISIFYRNGFEYYIKLQAGITVWFQKEDVLSDQQRKYFPDPVNFFTGVTLGGFNFFVSDHLGINLELNLWSPEMATVGMSYRFFKGEQPNLTNQ